MCSSDLYLDVRFRKQFSFAEDKVDMIVCLAFVVVEGWQKHS